MHAPASGSKTGGRARQHLDLIAHDHEQIEVRHSPPLEPASGEPVPVELQLYFFIPRNVGTNAINYPRDQFYGDLTYFMRLDLPSLSLEALANDEEGDSPLVALRHHLLQLSRGTVSDPPLGVEVKLFGHVFTETVREELARLRDNLVARGADPGSEQYRFLDEVDRFAVNARRALQALRRAQRRCEPFGRRLSVLDVFHATDEYASLYLDSALALLSHVAQQEPALRNGHGFVARLEQVLRRHAEPEARYRAQSGYLQLAFGEQREEYFTYRASALKKAVQQALYVESGRVQNDRVVRNATGAVAAGLAATWALVAQLPQQLAGLPPTVQTVLFALPVLAYMAKDRIKELSREWLTRRLRGFDHEHEIRAGALADAGLEHATGRIRETTRFVELADTPADVSAARNARRTLHLLDVAAETVLLHKRQLELSLVAAGRPARGVAFRQILRLNLRHFLTRLDEPDHHASHFVLDRGRFVDVSLPKVYHVNVVAKVETAGRRQALARWRIVLNKRGIIRIETVVSEADGAAIPDAALPD